MLTICNTSPLLYLNLIGQLRLLPLLYQEIVIPQAVVTELAAGASQGIQVPDPKTITWLQIMSVKSPSLLPLVIDLGAGETEVIGLALENPTSRVILDDQLGRRIALLNHLTVTGTLGVVVKAKQMGYLTKVKPIVQDLRLAGLWMSDSLEQLILAQAGE